MRVLFRPDDEAGPNEHAWRSLRSIGRTLSACVPRLPSRMLESQQPVHWTCAEDLARQRPARFLDVTSFTPREFRALLARLEPYIRAPRSWGGSRPLQGPVRGRKARATPFQRLFIAIHRLRTGSAHVAQTGIITPYHSAATVHKDFWHVLSCIDHCLGGLVQWPNAADRRLLAEVMPGLEGCIALVDATELRIQVPGHAIDSRECFSGKKKVHTVMMQVIVDPFGNIIDIDGGVGGRRNDINVWRNTYVGRRCAWHGGAGVLSPGEFIAGDCGYIGCYRILVPYRDGEMSPHTVKGRARRIFSNLIRRYRAVNEYIFGVIKTRYRMVGQVMEIAFHRVPLAFKAAALLTQWSIDFTDKPLRSMLFYNREELRTTDWEGRMFVGDGRFTPSLVRRAFQAMFPPRHASPAAHDVAHELTGRIAAAGTPPHVLMREMH